MVLWQMLAIRISLLPVSLPELTPHIAATPAELQSSPRDPGHSTNVTVTFMVARTVIASYRVWRLAKGPVTSQHEMQPQF